MSGDTVVVLGTSGMLGSMLVDFLGRNSGLDIIATVRNERYIDPLKEHLGNVRWQVFSVTNGSEVMAQLKSLGKIRWIINAIGATKPFSHDDDPAQRMHAIRVNALFPHWLAKAAEVADATVLQIATDCVYSGKGGRYIETDAHDAADVYGMTKSLGEAPMDSIRHLRCSIIGPEAKGYFYLLEWFCRQPENGKVPGFTNHDWNGITTLHFAKICQGIISNDLTLPLVHHVIPANDIRKYDLVRIFADCFSRGDVEIDPVEAPTVTDRTLKTENGELNRTLWQAAGYPEGPPTVQEMVKELADCDYGLRGILEK